MTVNNRRGAMRHIPEDELHAYIDQSLSRSQCVEIESHLAGCSTCRRERDDIAALRDRTTALLARLAPPRRIAPSFEELAAQAAVRSTRRRTGIRVGSWAASVAAAMVIGYTASSWLHQRAPSRAASVPVRAAPAVRTRVDSPLAVAVAESTATATAHAPTPLRHAAPRPRPPRSSPATFAAAEAVRFQSLPTSGNQRAELSSQQLGGADQPEFGGIWRTVSWDNARSETGIEPARIDGLPVMQVQVQQARESKKSIMVVAQQLRSGEMIRTIEGPVNDVSQLLARRGPPAAAPTSFVSAGPSASNGDGVMAMQRGDQLLAVTGRLPSDSLRAMVRRLNASLRTSGQ